MYRVSILLWDRTKMYFGRLKKADKYIYSKHSPLSYSNRYIYLFPI